MLFPRPGCVLRTQKRCVLRTQICHSVGFVSSRSMDQEFLLLSAAETELVSATKCVQETSFLRMMFELLGFPQSHPTVIFEVNNADIHISENPSNTSRTRHINLRRYYLKEVVRRDIIILVRVNTQNQHADFLTQPTSGEVLSREHRFVCSYP